MIDFSNKTYNNLLNEKLNNVPDSMDKAEGSMVYVSMAGNSYELADWYKFLALIQEEHDYRTASGIDLEHITEYKGIIRQPATKAIKKGTFNVEIPSGTRFSTLDNNLIYVSGDIILNENNLYSYQMTCETAGLIGNSYVGDLLAIDYVNGLQLATLSDIIISGADEETDGSLRARFELSFKQLAFGGNVIAYKEKIEAIDGVGLCQIYPADQYLGGSTLLCSIIDDEYRPASQLLIDNVQEIISPKINDVITNGGYGWAPIGAKPTITTGTELPITIECNIQFSSGDITTHRTEIEDKIKSYIREVMTSWATITITDKIYYNMSIYQARLISRMLELDFIVNVTDLTINGNDGDLILTENKDLQQIAVFGELIVNG